MVSDESLKKNTRKIQKKNIVKNERSAKVLLFFQSSGQVMFFFTALKPVQKSKFNHFGGDFCGEDPETKKKKISACFFVLKIK